MDITTLVIGWLSLLTLAFIVLAVGFAYLFRTGENTRLDAMRLRARLNEMSDKGNKVKLKTSPVMPVTQKIKLDTGKILHEVDDEEYGKYP